MSPDSYNFLLNKLCLARDKISALEQSHNTDATFDNLEKYVNEILASTIGYLLTAKSKDEPSLIKLSVALESLKDTNDETSSNYKQLLSKSTSLFGGLLFSRMIKLTYLCENLQTLKNFETIISFYMPILYPGEVFVKSLKRHLPDEFVSVFKGFLERDYYPTSDEKDYYARKYNLTRQQIDNWLWNNRSRMRKRLLKGPVSTNNDVKEKVRSRRGDVEMFSIEDVLDALGNTSNITLAFATSQDDFSYFNQIPALFSNDLFPS